MLFKHIVAFLSNPSVSYMHILCHLFLATICN